MPKRSDWASIAGLILFLFVCLGIGAIGSWVTAGSVNSWYPTLRKPSFNPPNWVFAPVWTTLYVLMAIAAWCIWRRTEGSTLRSALLLFGLQLALNLGWSVAFFGFRSIGGAMIVIVALDVSVLAVAGIFGRLDRLAAWLLAPYLLWIFFATALNVALWRLN